MRFCSICKKEGVRNPLSEFCSKCWQDKDVDVKVTITTDCRTEDGNTVDLIDSIIAISRVVSKRNLKSFEVKEALKKLQNDEDLRKLLYETKDK